MASARDAENWTLLCLIWRISVLYSSNELRYSCSYLVLPILEYPLCRIYVFFLLLKKKKVPLVGEIWSPVWATADDCDWGFDKLRGRHYHSQSKEVFTWENLYLGELNTRMTNWFRIVFTLFTRFPSSCRRHLGLTKSATRPSPRGGRFNTETSGCSSFTWHCREISHRNEILAPVQKLSWARTRMTHSDMKVQTKTTNRH